MEKILKLYTYVDGTNDTPFPSADEQVIIGSFTYTANRMGSAPQITATVKHRLCLDDIWNDKVYAEFNGEKYFVINTPSSSKSNDDTRYEHDLELLSEREVLNHVYFIDAVQGDSDTDVYKSNSTKVLFYGDIQQFVARLNASLSYRNLGYKAVIDDGITSEDKQVSFEDKYILEALQEEFNIFEIPYYFVGKVIHFGYTSNAITTTFKYGHDDAFLSISKDNANYALINRITGVGSSDNIPYYYPNETDDQSAVEASGKKWITPSQNLMPSIYRESEGAEMFYEAKNNTYPDGEGGYYQFENEYSDTNPREGKTDFEDIKPTITGITNAAGQRIDMFSEFAYDTNDNDEVDEEGNYLHPYFFAKLRKTDGTYGFNLFDHAIESQTMQITFTSGICGACTFEIAVGKDTQKNLVQVGETSGALMRDEDGNVLCGREDLQQPQTPQDRQNDTKNYEVWIALRKDNSTYPQVMPNVNYNYKPSTSDTFAILGISLPQAYILKAEDELEKSLVKHMWMNNVEKFTFSAKFSRIFFTEHPEVLAQLNENARVLIEYNGKQHTLYIDNYTYKMDSGSPLPEIDIDLVDTLSVGQNSLQTQLDSIKQDILSTVGGADFLKQGLRYFLRKDTSDTARGKITFVRGLDVGTFAENTSGGTLRVLEDLTTYAEVDKLRVRVKAYFETLEIINTNSVGGKMILTAGGGVYLREVKDRETLEDGTEQVWDFYRCYFLTEQDGREVENRFHVGDLAMSQSFNIKAGTHQGVTNHYYWREVVGIGDDYIDLSKTICDTGSDAPMAEDTVCHLGNRSDKDRQGAIIFSAVDVFSPSITLYYGINDFSLVNKDYVSYGVDKSTGNAFFRVYGEMYAGDREQTSYVKYTPGVGVEMRGKFLNQSGESYDTIIDSIQNAIDGNIETWFGEEEPTLSNEPAVNWTTDEDKNTHLGDLYYSDAGVAYRFQMEGAQYVWKMLKDSDITKALADAKAAKDAADAAQEAADAAADRLTAWASDGVISPTEKQGIKDEIARIDADKANITAQYTKYGLGTPTAFNNAYTAYRAVLVSLSASTPENIAIPSDFSSKQTYYYNERTSALGAIADASITSVNNVTEQLEQMQQDFAEVKQDVAGVKTSVDGLKNFTDEAFADGIVDRNESAAIASHINSIETFAKDAAESYTKVYENALLTGTAKTNLANAYTAFTTAKTELVTTINGAIADGLVDALEKSAVDGKYTAFNTKYGDFVANLNAANRAIQDAINQNALQALQKIGELDYLKAALKEFTTIEGGLIQSSTLALGYTSDSGYQVMAGTNGIYDDSKLGGGIASWWGGAMFDRFEYTEETMPENVASALVRMDGTGYFAKGNLWWESDGTLHADPLSFFVGEETVGDVLGLFQFVKSDAGIEYVIPQYPFQKLEIGNYLQIGKAQLYWDEENKAFYVRHEDGVTPVGFYATGFVSAKGANPDSGGTVVGVTALSELTDVSITPETLSNNDMLRWNGSKWVAVAMADITPDLSGYATQAWVTSQNYLKAVSLATISDLHSSWDAVLKAQKPAWLTTVSLATISDLHSTWDAVLKAAKPTTLAGYGITDAYTKTDSDSKYLFYTRNQNLDANLNATSIRTPRIYEVINGINMPSTNSWHQLFNWGTADSNYGFQMANCYTIQNADMFYRTKVGGSFGSWIKFLTNNNYSTTLDTRYVKKAGDTMTGALTINYGTYPQLIVNNSYGGISVVRFQSAGANKVAIGFNPDVGAIFQNNQDSNNYICLNNGNLLWNGASKFWHAGNDGAGSGLDADLLDGYHIKNIQTGGWISLTPYIYDATNGVRNYWYKIATIGNGSEPTHKIEIDAKGDTNYTYAARCTLYLSNYNSGTIKSVTISEAESNSNYGRIEVCMDTSGNVYIRAVNIQWTSYLRYRILYGSYGTVHESPTKTETKPANTSTAITSGGIKLNTAKAFEYTDNYLQGISLASVKLNTAHTIWGQPFDGTANITGALSGATTITASGLITGGSFITTYGVGNRRMQMSTSDIDFFASTGGWVAGFKILSNSGESLNQLSCGSYGDGDSIIYHFYGGNYNSPIMVIKPSNKYVGIGITSPSYKLHVAGDIYANTANIYASNVTAYNGFLKSICNGKTITIYSENASWCHYKTDATNGHWFGNNVAIQGNLESYGGTKNLGSNSARWNVWAGTGNFSGAVTMSSSLDVSGTLTAGNGILTDYTAGSWISMATRTNLIYSSTNNSSGSAHALFRVKDSSGNAICFGGVGADVGFHGFLASNISSNTNSRTWHTTWNVSTGKLTHQSDMTVTGSMIIGGTLNVTNTIYSSTGIWTNGYLSAKGQNTSSDMRLKDVLSGIDLSVKQIAKAPAFKFAWKDGTGIDCGSSAQYWETVLPECVREIGGYKTMAYANIALLSAISLARNFETLEQRVARLEKENKELKKKIATLAA